MGLSYPPCTGFIYPLGWHLEYIPKFDWTQLVVANHFLISIVMSWCTPANFWTNPDTVDKAWLIKTNASGDWTNNLGISWTVSTHTHTQTYKHPIYTPNINYSHNSYIYIYIHEFNRLSYLHFTCITLRFRPGMCAAFAALARALLAPWRRRFVKATTGW